MRAYRAPGDDEAIVALHGRIHGCEPTYDDTTLERWRGFTEKSHVQGGRDFCVIECDGKLVALMTSLHLEAPQCPGGIRHIRIAVDPDHRRRGHADNLLRSALEQARREGSSVLQSVVDGRWASGRSFAATRGFRALVHNLLLERDRSPVGDQTVPDGVELRKYQSGDEVSLARIHNVAMARDAEFNLESRESFAAHAKHANVTIWVAAMHLTVGYCFLELRGDRGYVHEIAVLPEWTGRGIGSALLARAIASLQASGATTTVLGVEEDNTTALHLYTRFGFSCAHDTFTLRRRVEDAL